MQSPLLLWSLEVDEDAHLLTQGQPSPGKIRAGGECISATPGVSFSSSGLSLSISLTSLSALRKQALSSALTPRIECC